jgi:hypothetical protein
MTGPVLDDLVGGDQRAAVLGGVERFARDDDKTLDLPGLRPAPKRATKEILAVHLPRWVSPKIRSTATHSSVVDAVASIAAADLPHWDGSAKSMQTVLFVEPSGRQGQAWHQDERFIPTRDRSLVGAWIALEDTSVENACAWVFPRSHGNGYLRPGRPHQDPEEFDPTDEEYGFDERGAVAAEVRAGSALEDDPDWAFLRPRHGESDALATPLASPLDWREGDPC